MRNFKKYGLKNNGNIIYKSKDSLEIIRFAKRKNYAELNTEIYES